MNDSPEYVSFLVPLLIFITQVARRGAPASPKALYSHAQDADGQTRLPRTEIDTAQTSAVARVRPH